MRTLFPVHGAACQECHDRFDFGTRVERDTIRNQLREHLISCYPDWDENKLYYKNRGTK